MKCIICSSSGPFQVSVKGVIEVHDSESRSDLVSDLVFDNDSQCVCFRCKHLGVVRDFHADMGVAPDERLEMQEVL